MNVLISPNINRKGDPKYRQTAFFLSFSSFLRIALYHPLVLRFATCKILTGMTFPGCQNDVVISEISVMDNQILEAKLANLLPFSFTFCIISSNHSLESKLLALSLLLLFSS